MRPMPVEEEDQLQGPGAFALPRLREPLAGLRAALGACSGAVPILPDRAGYDLALMGSLA